MKKRHHHGFVTEADLCTALGHWFSRRGYECYPEMEADLTVYHRGRDELIGIEAKLDLNFKVLDQALHKKRMGRHDAVLICTGASSISTFWAPRICGHPDIGMGVAVITRCTEYDQRIWGSGPLVEIAQRATHLKVREPRRDRLLELMCPEAQVYATPGSSGPLGFTDFRMLEVKLYREALKGPLSIPEARGIAGKKIHEKRFLEYFSGGAFKAIHLVNEHVEVRGPWGSREVGHSGITWAQPDPALVEQPSGALVAPPGPQMDPAPKQP